MAQRELTYEGAPIKMELKAAFLQRKKDERHARPESTFSAGAPATAPGESAAQPSAAVAGETAAAGTSGEAAAADAGGAYSFIAPLKYHVKQIDTSCHSHSICSLMHILLNRDRRMHGI